MKKILSVMLMLALMLSLLVSCGSEEPTAEDIAAAMKKTSELESVEMNFELEMSMSAEGMEMEIPMEGTVKTGTVDGKEVEESVVSMEMLGMEIETKSYTVDGYVYTETMGEKTKTPADENVSSTPEVGLTEIKADDIESFETSEDDAGTKFDIVLKEGAMDDQLGGMLGDDITGGAEVEYKDLKISVVVNDEGYAVKYNVEFATEASEEIGEITAKMSVEVKNPGEDVKIELPDDLDTYTEATAW